MTTTPSLTRPPLVPTLTAHDATDLLALAPVVLGFWPEHSIVMFTLGARRPFHARLDLPPLAEQTAATRRLVDNRLLAPARRHDARRVVLLYYDDHRPAAASIHSTLRIGCRRAGIGIAAALHVDGETYSDLEAPERAMRLRRTPYDVTGHPFVRDAIATGRLAHQTRDDLVASVARDPEAAQAVSAALLAGGHLDRGIPVTGRAVRAAGEWVSALVQRLLAEARADPVPLADPELARLVWVMQSLTVRDAAWALITASSAPAHVAVWRDVVRRAPDELAPAPAVLLGWAAWQAGDGALAWAAVDRARCADPHYRLAHYLAMLLENAVSPDVWTPEFDWAAGLPAASGPPDLPP
ncbi:hypothetical protein GCM10022237_08600 [Nocardioides ginsengisoli]|uniref:DUF4192 domain-containing protein n=1 Tax=Nocardioides ginsengisoli TaxID=363868 RepID=A0ABW3VZQ7_9ACTN